MIYLSIIIPVYNTITYLEQAIKSVLHQTFSNFEVIIVDDGSYDGSEKLADAYALNDSRIKVIHEVQHGVAYARNQGVKAARGKYLLFLDSDDYFSSDKAFYLIYEATVHSQPDTLFYGYIDVDMMTHRVRTSQIGFNEKAFRADKSCWLNYIYDEGLFPTACWQMAVKCEFIKNNNIHFPENFICEDLDWGIRVLYESSSYSYINECLITYRRNRCGSIMNNRGFEHLQGCILAIKNWIKIPKEKRYLGLTNFVAHLYGFSLIYYTKIPKSQRELAICEFQSLDVVLMESDKWNHHLIYYFLHLFGFPFTSWIIQLIYKLVYAPSSFLYIEKKCRTNDKKIV